MNLDKKPIYPIEPWNITETEFLVENNYRNETTFALSNGYIGTRGTLEEAYPFDIDTGLEGNFINGFYESEEIRYGEANFGSPLKSQSLLNLPNLKETKVYLGEELFDMRQGKVEEYRRILRMKDGILTRSLVWTADSGKRIQIEIRRLVSLCRKNIMAVRYCVTPLNFDGSVTFVSKLQADVENHTRKTNPIVDYGPFGRRLEPQKLYQECGEDTLGLLYYEGTAKNSGLRMACASLHLARISGGEILAAGADDKRMNAAEAGADDEQMNAAEAGTDAERMNAAKAGAEVMRMTGNGGALEREICISMNGTAGHTCILDKFICYTSNLDRKQEELEAFTLAELNRAAGDGYEALEQEQKDYMHRYWETADVKIRGNDELQQGIHFNLFHIMQSAARDGRTGMGAKGLSGEGYEGHYFWDTEMYVMPLLIYTEPETARRLLEYRYHTLDQARARARVLGHDKGALYPWRTINGEEASTYYPLGTAQYHINADIEYALALYLQVTGDVDFFLEMGAEMMIETARVWADVGSFARCRGGKYCICDVTGPDEYNVLVDNNFYTNLMAREHLRDAVKAVEYLMTTDCLDRLCSKLDFSVDEIQLWKKIVDNMYFPYDEERRVYPMDDGFMMRKPWDENKIPPEKRAWLYENYHPLFIMRHRMSKQADAILGMYLHSHLFTREELRRNYDFYQEVTLHHSSLSTCIFGILASNIGYEEEAYRYFAQSARMDLDDYHNNFYAGIHAANMAGTWQAIVNGFAGLHCTGNRLYFAPYLPQEWDGCTFRLKVLGQLLEVELRPRESEFRLLQGEKLEFFVNGKKVNLQQGGNYIEKV
ncbi:MAG: glycosyl hydrolase family 65 protein [Lachnospiraceae bacterium]|nr:glycosyl hydrolase family 65 protein [Lachnospiraceae bacterium]